MLKELMLRAGDASSFAVNTVFCGIAVIGRIVDAYHSPTTADLGWSPTRLYDFTFLCRVRHACSRTLKAVLGRVAIIIRIVHTYQPGSAGEPIGSGARLSACRRIF